jgi:hypothetical protein
MFERYAIFYTPTGALADFGAQWLGWDSAQGSAVVQPEMTSIDLPTITQTPHKYGLHGTLKGLCCTNRFEVDLPLTPDGFSLQRRYLVCQAL